MAPCLPFFGRSSASCLEYYTILYALLIVTQMMLDAALFQTIINIPPDSEVPNSNLYQCILIPVHCLQATLQFFFMFDLYKGIIKKSFRRARNWRMVFLCLLAIEVSVFVAYSALASFFSIFSYFTAFAILFKVYLIWPLRLFLEECSEVCVPLAHAILGDQDLGPMSTKPGPSGYNTGN